MEMKLRLAHGFTLVELLIVIAILGVIATVVIAAINPIEQANRARDSKYRSDAGQLLSAIERYFTSHSEFPWMTVNDNYTIDSSFGFKSADSNEVGICQTTGNCSTSQSDPTKYGVLIDALELKNEFMGRDFIKAGTDVSKQLMIGKSGGVVGSGGGSESVYACFIPLASSNRQTACNDGKVYTLSTSDGTRTVVPTATCTGAPASSWTGSKWYVCIPE